MAKIYTKNGFEYHCERNCFGGHWHTHWNYRPIGSKITLQFHGVKAELEKLLADPTTAITAYNEKVAWKTDIEAREKDLQAALKAVDRVDSPDFGSIRGMNPKKDQNRRNEAYDRLKQCRNCLEIAQRYVGLLKEG